MPASKKNSAAASKTGKSFSADQILQKLKPVAERMSSDRSLSLGAALEEAGIRSPLVLLSNQHLRVKRLVQWLREHLFEENGSSFSSHFGADLSTTAAADRLATDLVSLSLFTKNQLIVVYEADKMKAPAQKTVLEALPRATPSVLLILSAETISQRAPLLLEASNSGTVVELAELSGQTLERWIDREVSRVGIASGITPDAKQLLIRCSGGDVSHLAPEIEKLSLLVVPGEQISRALVEALSLRSPEVTSFELVKQLAAKSPLSAVALANDLLLQGLHPLQVNAFLSRAFRIMLANRERSGATVHPELSNPWFQRQLGTSASAFTLLELKSAINRLTQLDFQLKDSGLPSSLNLTVAIQEIAARAA